MKYNQLKVILETEMLSNAPICPTCNHPMPWIEGLLTDSGQLNMLVGRYGCCNVKMANKESIGLRQGRIMAAEYKNIPLIDPRIVALPFAVQLGIARTNFN